MVGERLSCRARVSSTRGAPSALMKSWAARPVRNSSAGQAQVRADLRRKPRVGRWQARPTPSFIPPRIIRSAFCSRASSRPQMKMRGWPPNGRRTGKLVHQLRAAAGMTSSGSTRDRRRIGATAPARRAVRPPCRPSGPRHAASPASVLGEVRASAAARRSRRHRLAEHRVAAARPCGRTAAPARSASPFRRNARRGLRSRRVAAARAARGRARAQRRARRAARRPRRRPADA